MRDRLARLYLWTEDYLGSGRAGIGLALCTLFFIMASVACFLPGPGWELVQICGTAAGVGGAAFWASRRNLLDMKDEARKDFDRSLSAFAQVSLQVANRLNGVENRLRHIEAVTPNLPTVHTRGDDPEAYHSGRGEQ